MEEPTMSNKSEEAVKYFNSGYNCCQSVVLAFTEDVGLGNTTAARLANGFGGGLSWTDNMCGTAYAIALLISLKNGKELPDEADKQLKTFMLTKQAIEEFKDAFEGKNKCTELLGYNLSIPEQMSKAVDEDTFHKVCNNYVAKAAEIAEKYLKL